MRRASVGLLVAGMLLTQAGTSCARVAPIPADPPVASASSTSGHSVSLSRSACYGTCPVYSVSLDQSGGVVFQGERHVRQIGRATATVPSTAVAALLAELDGAGFQTMAERYAFGEAACGRYASDLPTLVLTVVREGRTKRVEYDQGCTGAPASLVALARRIDEVAGSARWITGR